MDLNTLVPTTPIAALPAESGEFELVRSALRRQRGKAAGKRGAASFTLLLPDGTRATIPMTALKLFTHVVEVLASGNAVTLVPMGKELTTQQAAGLLNVSRQYVVRLLNEGAIPHHKLGTHRRLRIEDVLAYKAQRDKQRRAQLRTLTRFSEAAGGYDLK